MQAQRPLKSAFRSAAAFWCDTGGTIIPYVTIMLVVIVGVAVLALDGARYMSLQTQMQNGADALALAGAAELDRLPDAEVRAMNAMRALVANSTQFGAEADRNVRIDNIRFFSALPANDVAPMSGALMAADPTDARFVAVNVHPVTLPTVLPASLFGGESRVTAGASAVAGFDQVVCQITPLYVCNPFETRETSGTQAVRLLQEAAASTTTRRRLIRLRQYPGGEERYEAGDYGFLRSTTPGETGRSLVDAVARLRGNACFVQTGVQLWPGFLGSVRDAFNVRFDIYGGSMSAARSDPDYRPALNVRKGYVGGGSGEGGGRCNAQPATNWPIGSPPVQATGLPLDRTWPFMDGRMGAGDWDFDTYWQVNHGGAGRAPPTVNGEPASNSSPPSRYEVYRYEIAQGLVGDVSTGGESGAPACYGGPLANVPDRRILYAAVLNCQSLGLTGGTAATVPVAAFAKLFLTLPLQPSQTDIYVELVGLMRPGDALNFDRVQLYR